MSTTVKDLRNPKLEYVYDLAPEQSVRNAYAQYERKDFNTWDYAKYDHLVVHGLFSVSCGDYTALKNIHAI